IENYNPMEDEPMWAADCVVVLTPGSTITIPETANEFAIKALFERLLREIQAFSQHENETLTDAWLRMKEMLRNCHGHNLTKGNIIVIFYHGLNEITQEALNAAAGGSSNSDTDKIMARMDAMTMKMDAQYKELQSYSNHLIHEYEEDDKPMSPEAKAKFMQTFRLTRFYNNYNDRDSNRNNWRSNGRNNYNRDKYRSNSDDKPDLHRQLSEFIKAQESTNSFADKQSGRPSRSLPTSTQPNLKCTSSKLYQPPQAQNEHVNIVFIQSGKSYDPPTNPNDQQNDSKNPINFDSEDEEEESTP
ncbi:reverse transcriptase domain-containing protein, partial [Tanacetum coccineum]